MLYSDFFARFLLALLLTASLISNAVGDEVILNNGDRITGTLVEKKQDRLVLETPYAGRIRIQWDAVAELRTDKPVYVKTSDEEELMRQLGAEDEGAAPPLKQIAVLYPDRPAPAPAIRHSGRANVGINISEGNTDARRYHVDSEWIARTRLRRYTTGLAFNQTEDSGQTTEDNTRLYGKLDHFINGKWYLYGNLELLKDRFKDIDLRSTIGLGSGYQFMESEDRNLSLEGGISHVEEQFITVPDDHYQTARWALKFDQQLFDRFAQFFHEHIGNLDIADAENLEISARTGLRFPILKGLAATAEYDIDWDNQPAAGSDRIDNRYLLNLGYSW